MKTLKITTLLFALILMYSCKADTKKEIEEPLIAQVQPPVKDHYIKVALLLDTSNSMDGLIDQAKAQLWEIVNELSYSKYDRQRPKLQIALYEYGNDNLNSKDNYIRKILNFTEDLDDVSKELFSLSTNGGSEYCGAVIQESLDKLDWGSENDDLKMMFIAGNEPFDQGPQNYKAAAANAQEKGVVVNTIFCGDYRQGINTYWKDGAMLAYGDYLAIDQNVQTVHVATPYDDIIIQLNLRLNKTYVPYGSRGESKQAVQMEQDDNAAEYSKANAVSRTVSKGSHLYKNSSWDLVDAEKEENFDYDKLKKDELPAPIAGKSTPEIKKYLKEKRLEREKIQKEIMDVNEKRRLYLKENATKTDNGLENAMIQAVKKQAEKKDYTWEK